MQAGDTSVRYAHLFTLSRLPPIIRLGLVTCCFVGCAGLQVFSLLVSHSFALSALFAFPAMLAAWLFKWRGALLSVGASILLFLVTNTLFVGSILWPLPLLVAFLTGSLVLIITAFGVSAVRTIFDLMQDARRQAQRAQEHLELAYERQCQLDHLKDHFLLHISHELRTPLTIVRGYLELLRNQGGQLDTLAQQHMLDAALLGCDDLQHLVESVLEVAQRDHTGLRPCLEEFALADLVRSVLVMMDPCSLQNHKICQQEIPETLRVLADRQYVRQIVHNLLSNALKYSPAHTLVSISARVQDEGITTNQAASTVVVCVRDTGPGIPPEHIPMLFHKFVRLQRDVGGPVSGTGLGLYICQQLAEGMGGRIWVESSGVAGEGCRFFFTLPGAFHSGIPKEEVKPIK